MLSQLIRETPQANGSEEVDREASVLGGITGEHTIQEGQQKRVMQASIQLVQAQILHQLLEEDFDKDTTRRIGVVLIQANVLQNLPTDGTGVKEMSKEFRQVANGVGFQSMDFAEPFGEALAVKFLVDPLHHAQALGQQSSKAQECPCLQTHFDNHVAHFNFLPRLHPHAHDLVCTLLVVQTGHNHQIDLPSQGNQHRVTHVLHRLLLDRGRPRLLLTLIT